MPQRNAGQRQDARSFYQEQSEITVIQEYMPEGLSDDEIMSMVEQAINNAGASSMQDMGKVMGQLKPKMQGRADMGKVSGLVKQQLSN